MKLSDHDLHDLKSRALSALNTGANIGKVEEYLVHIVHEVLDHRQKASKVVAVEPPVASEDQTILAQYVEFVEHRDVTSVKDGNGKVTNLVPGEAESFFLFSAPNNLKVKVKVEGKFLEVLKSLYTPKSQEEESQHLAVADNAKATEEDAEVEEEDSSEEVPDEDEGPETVKPKGAGAAKKTASKKGSR